jgi:hypothetical protein
MKKEKETTFEEPKTEKLTLEQTFDRKYGPEGWDGINVKMSDGSVLVAVANPGFDVVSKIIALVGKGIQNVSLKEMADVVKLCCISHPDPDKFDRIAAIKPILVPKLFGKLNTLANDGVDDAKKGV